MRGLRVALLLSLAAASGASGQTIDPDKAQAWLERTYGIKSERVAEATPDELVVLKTIEPRPPSDFRVVAHYENFTPPDPLTPPSSDREYFINCPSRRFHVDRIESFSEHGGRGAQSTSFGPTLWGLAIPNSPDDRIIAGVCGPSAAQLQLQAEQALTPPAPVQILTPTPLPAALPTPAPPVIEEPKPAPVRPTAASPKGAPKPRPVRVQLFAGLDREMAQHFIDGLPARLPDAGKTGRLEIVEGSSGGVPVYRVQITGFASSADAVRFCATAKAAGQDCFVPRQAAAASAARGG